MLQRARDGRPGVEKTEVFSAPGIKRVDIQGSTAFVSEKEAVGHNRLRISDNILNELKRSCLL